VCRRACGAGNAYQPAACDRFVLAEIASWIGKITGAM
jgi:hypothetical protein